MSVIVDTAALALHLGCTPAHVRRLVKRGIITTLGRAVGGHTGRPTMWFNTDQVDKQLAERRNKLDAGQAYVRKS